ncbi:MAG: zinc ribbon domain-containing protein [Proteobacteria bacterium]|nr:zinc ribbon domain-containing protein [Desulfobacteraceae bacterium]MBU4002599.1 zinc ribbon domain-containing protein [Pseudomonadota bacterium]MBU4055396.1 zinc ribbon domain-containing protein [Pseudomonadota bacterium]MBU4317294.1 zinc ribbon domain-containing protein [Pseudomonadota bacterium]MBU4471776.1 zinc ribbon domain-containing protein [Pseudomonadota bacterium]
MPIFEFHCSKCNHHFEYLVMGGDAPKKCPECNGKKIVKLMSACGFLSKGSGGETVRAAAGSSGCGGCSSTNCGSCGH